MAVKRALSPVTNPAGLSAAGMAVYAAAVMIYNTANHHGVINVPVIVAAVAAVAAWYTRQKVTPVADPKDGNGAPLLTPVPGTRLVVDPPPGLTPPPGAGM